MAMLIALVAEEHGKIVSAQRHKTRCEKLSTDSRCIFIHTCVDVMCIFAVAIHAGSTEAKTHWMPALEPPEG